MLAKTLVSEIKSKTKAKVGQGKDSLKGLGFDS